MAAQQKESDSRLLALRQDSLARGKALILQAAKDDLSAQQASDKTAAADELARYRQKLQSMAAQQKESDSRLLALRQDSLARGKALILQAAKDELIKFKSAETSSKSAKNVLADLAKKDQEFLNRYKNATQDLVSLNSTRAESLLDYMSVVRAVYDKSPDFATKKFGSAAVGSATGADFDALKSKLQDTNKQIPPLLQGFKALGGRLIDVHSATRGLASGFNLLWLTWGQLGPLFAGAAISMGTKSILTLGAEVGHQLETVRVLSQETDTAIQGLNASLLATAKSGPHGPLEVAKAMKTLSLAGLEASQVQSALPRVMQFAVAGTTTIDKAAEVMTGVATAFGYTAENFDIVGDAITKTAAASKAGVEDMGEAFKAASVVSSQFGVNLKDVSLLLALQANLNIKNSAAGTNVRNMYTDLSGRSKESRKLLKEFNLELTDSEGNFKDVISIARELDKVFSNLSGKSAKAFKLQLASERGGKPITALYEAYKTEIREFSVVNGQVVETVTNQLEQLKKRTEDASGFMAVSAAKLAMTPLSQMQSVVATLQSSLLNAFSGMEDDVIVFSARLKDLFNSKEFENTLSNLIRGVASFTEALLENLDVVGKVILGYAGFKVLATTASLFIGLDTWVKSTTASLVAYKTAQGAAAGADFAAAASASAAAAATARVGGTLVKAIPVIGTVVSIGTAAWSMWELYNLTQSKTAEASKTAADGLRKSGIISALEEETKALDKQNKILAMSLTLKRRVSEAEFNARNLAEDNAAAQAKQLNDAEAQVKASIKKEAAIRQVAANLSATLYKSMGAKAAESPAVKALLEQADREAEARKKVNSAKAKDEVDAALEARQLAAKLRDEQGAAMKKYELKSSGTQTFDPDAKNTSDRSAKAEASAIARQISAVEKAGASRVAALKSSYDMEVAVLEKSNSVKLISDGAYQSQLTALTEKSEAERLAEISNTDKLVEALYVKELSRYKAGTEEYKAIEDKRTAYLESSTSNRTAIETEANKRRLVAEIEHQGRLKKIQSDTEEYLADLKGERAKEAALTALNRKYEDVNESSSVWLQAEKASAFATVEAAAKHEAKLRELEKAYEAVKKDADALKDSAVENLMSGNTTEGAYASWQKLNEQKIALEKTLGTFRASVEQDIANQSAIAYEEAFRKRASEFKNSLSEALSTALIEGGKDGSKSLRKLIENELKSPFTVLFRMSIDALMSAFDGSGSAGGSGGSGGLSGVMSSLSSVSTLKTAYEALSGAIEGSIGKSFENFAKSSWGEKLGLSQSSNAGYTLPSDLPGTMAETSEAFTAATNELTSVGKTFTNVGTNIAANFAGQALRKGISGGYSVGGTGEKLMDVAAIASNYFPVIGPIVAGAVSGIINIAFGHKFERSGLRGTFANSGFSGQSYQNYEGGWFSSDRTDRQNLDSSTVNQFTNSFRAIQASTAVLAINMGLSADAALNFRKNVDVRLDGLSADEQKSRLTEMFTAIQEDMAKATLDAWGDWSAISKYGETASQVLTTVSNNLTGFNGMLDMLDLKLVKLNLSSAAAASSVIEAAGGIDALTGAYGSYYENFYSDSERNSKVIETIGEKFASLGVTMPALVRDAEGFVTNGEQARDTFRSLVTAIADAGDIALTTELVKLSKDFAAVATVSDKLEGFRGRTAELQAELLKAEGNTKSYESAVVALEKKGLTPAEGAVYDFNKVLESSIVSLDKVTAARETASSAEIRLLEAQGLKAEALAKQRELDIKGMSEVETAAYDYSVAVDLVIENLQKEADFKKSLVEADVRLLEAQGNAALAAAKQREKEIKGLSRAEIAAYDYGVAVDKQVKSLERAAGIVSKLSTVSGDIAEYLKQFNTDSGASFARTISDALSGDLNAMGKVTDEADKAIEKAKASSKSTSEFLLSRAGILSKVLDVKQFADTLTAETDTDRLIAAIRGDTNTSTAVDELGTRLSSNDIAVSLNATLETVQRSGLAATEIETIQGLFSDMHASVSSMALDTQASVSGQTILGMFDSMRATVLTVAMNASEAELEKVTDTFSNLTAFVTQVSSAGLSETSSQIAIGTAANITAAITSINAGNNLTEVSAQTALSSLANISAYISSIQVSPGEDISGKTQAALGALASVSANISEIQVASGTVEARKASLQSLFSSIAANIASITLTEGLSDATAADLVSELSNISARVSEVNTSTLVTDATAANINGELDSLQASVSSIAITAPESNLTRFLSQSTSSIASALAVSAALVNGTGSFGLTAEQASSLVEQTSTIRRYVSVAAGTASTLTDVQLRALLSESSEIVRTVSAVSGSNTLSTEQKQALTEASETITKTISATSGTGVITADERLALTSASATVERTISAARGLDTVTANQLLALQTASGTVVRTINAASGSNTLTATQLAALQADTATVTRTINAIGGSNTLSTEQKNLLNVLTGASGSNLTVGGSVAYTPARSLSDLYSDLESAIGDMTDEIKRSTDIANARSQAEQLLSARASAVSDVRARLATLDAIAKAYGIERLDAQGKAATTYVTSEGAFYSSDKTARAISGSSLDLYRFYYELTKAGIPAVNVGTEAAPNYELRVYKGSSEQAEIASINRDLDAARAALVELGVVPGFSTGGYTGPGGVNETAGIVHKGEVVWSQSDIARAGGLSIVEALRTGSMEIPAGTPAPAVTYNGVQSTINFDDSALLEELQALREEVANLRVEARASAVSNNKTAKLLKEFDERGVKVKNVPSETLTVTSW
jgi:hypothetical protein